MSIEKLEDKAYAIALLGLDGMGPARLERLKVCGNFSNIWDFIQAQSIEDVAKLAKVGIKVASSWKSSVKTIEPKEVYAHHVDNPHCSVEVLAFGEDSYPVSLLEDPEPPAILFARGLYKMGEIFDSYPVVGIVGTRNCTRYGADIAFELGRELALAGVVVLSGLALGIDYSAHFGSTQAKQEEPSSAPSVAVVGSGLDIVYPRGSQRLYDLVFENGAIISEAPLGSPPQRWRFPARNRIIAGLADMLIVVESHLKGGSLITAEEAGLRGKNIMAVPGSIRNPASTGTNHLIAEGCQPLTDFKDVFMALDILGQKPDNSKYQTGQNSTEKGSNQITPEAGNSDEQILLDSFCWEVVDFEVLLKRSNLEMEQLSCVLEGLIQKGLVVRQGLNFERCQPNTFGTNTFGTNTFGA